MKRTQKFFALGLIGMLGLTLSTSANSAPTQADQTGYQLLERLVQVMVKAVAPGGTEDINQGIILLAKELKTAREAKRMDDLFAIRYSRLLSVIRQAVLKDPEVLYWPMYRYSMVDFIEERTGWIPDWKELLFIVNDHGGSGIGLAFLADAIMNEVVSLHIHLDNLAKRPDILKAYMEKSMKGIGEGK